MALCMAVFAGVSGPVAARFGAHRTVAFGLVLNAVGLYLFWLLGRNATFASLMPGFVLFGDGRRRPAISLLGCRRPSR